LADKQLDPVTFEPIYHGLDSVSSGLVDIEKRKTWGKAVVRVRNEGGEVVVNKGESRAKL
jgi:NADPH2:quinone reductase